MSDLFAKTQWGAGAEMTKKGPMDGVRVVDLSVNILGPVATQMMGDMGADVIKVESPDGDFMRSVGPVRNEGMGAFFLNMNRNKRGIVLDLKDPKSKEALYKLLDSADVFVHNMRPGAVERLGLDYATIKERYPKLIYAWASGFRKDSDRRELPAYDDVIQGMSGIADLFQRRSGVPDYVPTMIADKVCGYTLALAISTALFHRERTGEAQEIHVPMYDTMVSFNLIDHLWHGVLDEPEKGLGYQRALTPTRRPYATKDGYIAVMPSTDSHWARMFQLFGRAEWADDPRFSKAAQRVPRLPELYGWVAEKLIEKTTAEWQVQLAAAHIPNGPVNTLERLVEDPYLRDGGFFLKQKHSSEGKMVTMAHTTHYSESPAAIYREPPRLSQHTKEVLESVGCSEVDIADILKKTVREHR